MLSKAAVFDLISLQLGEGNPRIISLNVHPCIGGVKVFNAFAGASVTPVCKQLDRYRGLDTRGGRSAQVINRIKRVVKI